MTAAPSSGSAVSSRGDAGDEADIGADGKIQIVDGDDAKLCDGRQRDRHREVQHQVEAEIADRARIEVIDGQQDDQQRESGQQDAREPARRALAGQRRTRPGERLPGLGQVMRPPGMKNG